MSAAVIFTALDARASWRRGVALGRPGILTDLKGQPPKIGTGRVTWAAEVTEGLSVFQSAYFMTKIDLHFKNTKMRWVMGAFSSSPIVVCLGKCFFLGGALGVLRGPWQEGQTRPSAFSSVIAANLLTF